MANGILFRLQFIGLVAAAWLATLDGRPDLYAQTVGTVPPTVYPYPESIWSAPQLAPTWSYAPPLAAYRGPTLGITPNSAYRPGGPYYRPEFGYQRAYRLPIQQTPGLNIEIPAADTVPSITYPQPLYPGTNSAAAPQLPPLTAGWPSPAPPYQPQPLLKLQNLPPGTYPGQGIVGQPKAYVDGQPVRNLLRYFSPW